jgi:hypothetical protein
MAATLVLRTVKGAPLTNLEVDNNFSNLNTFGDVVSSNIGVLSALTTTSTSNIVFAVNSIKSGNLSQFGSTTSAQLVSIMSDETGTGSLVFATTPTLVTPVLGLATGTSIMLSANIGAAAGNISGNFTAANFQTSGNLNSSGLLITTNSTVGTVVSGTWQGTVVATTYGGTGNGVGYAGGGAASTATVAVTDDTSTSATYYPLLGQATSGNTAPKISSTKLTFDPSTGILTSTDYNSSSDMTLKQDVVPIVNPLDIISQLTGFGFTWKDSKEKSFGLSAQEVEKVIPEIVRNRPDGTKGINYMNLTAFLIEAIKDLKQEIQELKQYK